LPRRSHHTVLFDLETIRGSAELGGWHKIHQMRVATGAVLHLQEGRMETFGEDRVDELIARLEAAELVVGFNVKRFDYEVLGAYTGIDYRRKLPTLDLWEEVRRRLGFRLGLNHLVEATLGARKTADGLQSLEWVKQGRMDLVEAYCRHDVELLRDLYLFGRRMGYVLYRDKEKNTLKLPVEW
jgi:DEAD/DEAH box helicase domain-containing protein